METDRRPAVPSIWAGIRSLGIWNNLAGIAQGSRMYCQKVIRSCLDTFCYFADSKNGFVEIGIQGSADIGFCLRFPIIPELLNFLSPRAGWGPLMDGLLPRWHDLLSDTGNEAKTGLVRASPQVSPELARRLDNLSCLRRLDTFHPF